MRARFVTSTVVGRSRYLRAEVLEAWASTGASTGSCTGAQGQGRAWETPVP